MSEPKLASGTVHIVPKDMRKALVASKSARAAWESLTPLARNEWICWTISVKKDETRKEHVERMVSKLKEGSRRPCCWIGCIHRKDKPVSASVRGVMEKRAKN